MGGTEKSVLADLIQKRRNHALNRQGWISLLLRLMFFVLLGWLLLTQVFFITRVSGNGMFPAVKDGDLLIGFRILREYREDDVIVYTIGNQTHVGRVVAGSADVVSLDESGTLLVNGTAQSGEIVYPTYSKEGLDYPYTVPDESVFVLGDYRTQTEDSRDFGSIPVEDIQGRVITIFRRRGL